MNNNTKELDILNIPIWIEYIKNYISKHGEPKNKIVVYVWDNSEEHKLTVYNLILQLLGDLAKYVRVEKISIATGWGTIAEQARQMLADGCTICNMSISGAELKSYTDEYPILQEFMDKVYINNAVGNSYDKPSTQCVPLSECTVEAVAYRVGIIPPLKLMPYSSHEIEKDGIRRRATCGCLTEMYSEYIKALFKGTSCATPVKTVLDAIINILWELWYKRTPTTKEFNAMTFENFFIEYDGGDYNGVIFGNRKLATLPPVTGKYIVLSDGKAVIMKNHRIDLEIGSATYYIDGQDQELIGGMTFDAEWIEVPDPVIATNGRTKLPVILFDQFSEMFGLMKYKVQPWDRSNPKSVVILIESER